MYLCNGGLDIYIYINIYLDVSTDLFVDASTNTKLTPDGPMEGVTILSLQTIYHVYKKCD